MTIRKAVRLFVVAVGFSVGLGTLAADLIAAEASDRDEHPHHERRKGLDKIDHIVFIVKENRTFDNYFGTFQGADGATSGKISTGEVIPLRHAPDMTPRDIDHSYQAAVEAIDGGAMDRFDLIKGGNVNGDYLATRNTTNPTFQTISHMRAISCWPTHSSRLWRGRVSRTISTPSAHNQTAP